MLFRVGEIHEAVGEKGRSKLSEAASTRFPGCLGSPLPTFPPQALTQAMFFSPVPEPVNKVQGGDVRGGGARGLG